jgi:hypothetical protein
VPETPAPKKGKFTFKPRTPVVDNTQQASPSHHQVYNFFRQFSGSRFLKKLLPDWLWISNAMLRQQV